MSQFVRQDDSSIADEERLFRRIHPCHIVADENTGQARVSSGAFRDTELSIHIESTLLSTGKSSRDCLLNYPQHRLVAITAGTARHFQQAVCRDPQPGDSSHGLVCGSKNNRRIHKGLCESAVWVTS